MPDLTPGKKMGQGAGAGCTRGLSVINIGDSGVTTNNLVSCARKGLVVRQGQGKYKGMSELTKRTAVSLTTPELFAFTILSSAEQINLETGKRLCE